MYLVFCGSKVAKWHSLRIISCLATQQRSGHRNVPKIRTDSSEYYCLQLVKKFDYENFIASLLLKSHELRRTALTLRAFNVELSQVRDIAKSDQMAHIRFQFWLDIVENIYDTKQNSMVTDDTYRNFPVAFELQNVIHQSKLSKHWLLKLIHTRRETGLGDFPFETMQQLEAYCDGAFSSLYYLLNQKAIELSSSNEDFSTAGYRISLDHIASHIGKAQGISNMLRGIAHNAASRRCYIPNDVLLANKCTHEHFLQGHMTPAACDTVYQVASTANDHLQHAVELLHNLKPYNREHKLLYLSFLSTEQYLSLLQRCHFDLTNPKLYKKNGILPLKLWWKAKFI